MKKRITIWESWDKKESEFVHNHFEDNWVSGLKPRPIKPEFGLQAKAWPRQRWQKSLGFINENQEVSTCLTFKNTSLASKI